MSTDKVDTEIPSPVAGTLTDHPGPGGRGREGGRASRGVISTSPPGAPPAPSGSAVAPANAPSSTPLMSLPTQSRMSRAPSEHLTPVVRRLATELTGDLSTVTGTGLQGRIRKQDVLRAAVPAVGTTSVPAADGGAGDERGRGRPHRDPAALRAGACGGRRREPDGLHRQCLRGSAEGRTRCSTPPSTNRGSRPLSPSASIWQLPLTRPGACWPASLRAPKTCRLPGWPAGSTTSSTGTVVVARSP